MIAVDSGPRDCLAFADPVHYKQRSAAELIYPIQHPVTDIKIKRDKIFYEAILSD